MDSDLEIEGKTRMWIWNVPMRRWNGHEWRRTVGKIKKVFDRKQVEYFWKSLL